MPQASMTYDPSGDERTLAREQEGLVSGRMQEASGQGKVVIRTVAAISGLAAVLAVFHFGNGFGTVLRGTKSQMASPIQLEESCDRAADKVQLKDVIEQRGFPLCVKVADVHMPPLHKKDDSLKDLDIIRHGWGYTCPVAKIGVFTTCYEVKCEKKSVQEMGEHAADLAQKHVGGLMSSLSDALTGSDDKEEKEKKKKDKDMPDTDLGATVKSAWNSMLSDSNEKDVCIGSRKVHVWPVTE
ncbi:unnamed protein product [Symbiodinium natans]|uniref:Uncharacterized protein n=1 Tax=Symbiodinium natans TaxID=878477 RepID=A0A812TQ90_9DINO|nr:unnamed protein product [Symbiodinium natans]